MKQPIENRVLQPGAAASENFYRSDLILRHAMESLSPQARETMRPHLERLGAAAAGPMTQLSALADRNGPELLRRNVWGEDVFDIRFHPAYGELLQHAVDSRMLHVKWEPGHRAQFPGENHRMGFAAFYLYAMTEMGIHCPLCMTDGAALLIDRYMPAAEAARLLPAVYTLDPAQFQTGAMFLTEKAGGSDLGRSLTQATAAPDGSYRLNGEKWFCSNANAGLIFTLARSLPEQEGIRGLTLFLVEKQLPDGSRNPIEVLRLKDKLGVRSMASAECMFRDTVAMRVGPEGEGFKLMADMVNLSRLHNALAAVSAGRRALAEAWHFLNYRTSFGKRATEHALVRHKLQELSALQAGQFYLLWRSLSAFDHGMAGNERESQLLRLLTPMLKKSTAETAIYIIRESMELMGGLGYIEDGIMPRLMRDALVLPIWEGAGNIQTLDMLRASRKSAGLEIMFNEIETQVAGHSNWAGSMLAELEDLRVEAPRMDDLPQDEMELAASYFFERLTRLYRQSVLLRALDARSAPWIEPALACLGAGKPASLPDAETLRGLMAWEA